MYLHKTSCFCHVESRAVDTGSALVSHSQELEINEDPEQLHIRFDERGMFVAVVV